MLKNIPKILFVWMLCFVSTSILAYSESDAFGERVSIEFDDALDYSISGKVMMSGIPVEGASVFIETLNVFDITNAEGYFSLNQLPPGRYILSVSYLGAEAYQQSIDIITDVSNLIVNLTASNQVLDEIEVKGTSQATELIEAPLSISSLDAKELQSQSLGAEELLKQTTGVIVRQDGGLGGRVNINLNGLTGAAVRTYYDGIPLEIYGGGVQMNNIPVDALERIDIYKGVMPVEVGTDALGGGINLVPSKITTDQLRLSYSVGSFNTHRATLSGKKRVTPHLSFSGTGYYNYSDNDFTMRDIRNLTEVVLDNGLVTLREDIIDAKRFHNQHQSAFGEAAMVLQELRWTDFLTLGVSYSFRFDEMQHGRTLQSTSIGAADRELNSLSARIDYKKKLLNDQMDVRYFGTLTSTQRFTRDTSLKVFNWTGDYLRSNQNSNGSELFGFPTLRKGDNLGTAHRVTLKYAPHKRLNFTFSNFFSYLEITGNDPVGPRLTLGGEQVDPNTIPSKLQSNISGLELETKFFDSRLTAVAFFKNYDYNAESINILQRGATFIPIRSVNQNLNGYGCAVKYEFSPSLYVKSSYERATRLPTETEIFGDFASIVPNYGLRAESSNNINVGVRYQASILELRSFAVQIDGFIRNQEDLIRIDDFGPENAIFVNEAKVDGRGVELALDAEVLKDVYFQFNATYQENIITTPTLGNGGLTGAQVPNMPNLFANGSLRYRFDKIGSLGKHVQLAWTYFFVYKYSINEILDLNRANPEFIIPTQHLHNFGFVYQPNNESFSFGVDVRNVFDNKIYDNFRIPRPGINYSFKINYTIN